MRKRIEVDIPTLNSVLSRRLAIIRNTYVFLILAISLIFYFFFYKKINGYERTWYQFTLILSSAVIAWFVTHQMTINSTIKAALNYNFNVSEYNSYIKASESNPLIKDRLTTVTESTFNKIDYNFEIEQIKRFGNGRQEKTLICIAQLPKILFAYAILLGISDSFFRPFKTFYEYKNYSELVLIRKDKQPFDFAIIDVGPHKYSGDSNLHTITAIAVDGEPHKYDELLETIYMPWGIYDHFPSTSEIDSYSPDADGDYEIVRMKEFYRPGAAVEKMNK